MNDTAPNPGGQAFYVIGGTLRYDAPCYVDRQADKDLHAALRQGEFCYVLTPRQMGKSSLMVRTVRRLRQESVAVAVLDLTAIGQNLSVEQWYEGLMGRLGQQLDLEDELEDFWRDFQRLSPVQRLFHAIREIVMPRRPGPVAVFVDEIDSVRSLPFSTDEFFAAIRECYNRRAMDAECNRLTFCLLGVATPSDLIRDPRTTPFNIGRRIELNDFTPEEARGLAEGFRAGRSPAQVREILKRILYWTHGHPYLTQRLCKAVAEDPSVETAAGVDVLCDCLFLSDRARERDDNLIFVRERLLRAEADRVSLLDLYSQVYRGRRVPDDPTNRLAGILRLSGITRVQDGYLVVRMPIYQRVFDRKWVLANMPDAEVRRQREAYWQGIFRAAAVALLVIVVMGILARYGFQQAELARFNALEEGLQRKRAENARSQLAETLSQLEIHQTEMMFREDRSSAGVAYLAHVLRNNPTNRVAAERLLAALTERSFALPHIPSFEFSADEFTGAYTTHGLIKAIAAHGVPLPKARSEIESLNKLLREKSLPQHFPGMPQPKDPFRKRVWSLSERERIRSNRDILETYCPDQCPKSPEMEVWRQERMKWSDRAEGSGPGSRRLFRVADTTAERRLEIQSDKVLILNPKSEPLTDQPLRHDGTINSARFSPDGQRVVTASRDNTARVWDAITGQPITPPMRHADSVDSAEFDPNGLQVVTACFDHTVRIWDAYSGQPLTEPLKHTNFVAMARFTSDGTRIITFAPRPRSSRIWDIRPGQALAEPLRHQGVIVAVQFSPDGRRLLTASKDKTARVWEVRTGLPLTPPLRHDQAVNAAQFSPDGRLVATASDDHTARLWDAATGKPMAIPALRHDGAVTGLRFSPDGSRLVTVSLEDQTARIWEVATGQPVGEPFRHEHRLVLARFSPDGLKLVTATEKGGENEGDVFVWEIASRKLVAGPLLHEGPVLSAHFDAAGKRLVTASLDNTARIWDATTGQMLTEPLTHNSIVNSARFSPDGRWVITASADRTARVWDAQTGQPAGGALLHDTSVVYARFFPDGQRVLTACSDKSARIWDAQSSQPLSELLTQEKSFRFAQIGFAEPTTTDLSRDGHWLATANGTGDAFVWEALAPPLPVPEWLPELAEDIAGDRINQRGLTEAPSLADFSTLKRKLLSSKDNDFYTRWVRWFLDDRSNRPLSPSSAITVKEYVERRIQENTLASLQEAVRLAPTNGPALARLARATLEDPAATARTPAEALFLSRRAVDLAPASKEVGRMIIDLLDKANQPPLLNEPELWDTRGRALETLKRLDEAEAAYSHAIELAKKQKKHEAEKRSQEDLKQLRQRQAKAAAKEKERK